MFCKVCGRPLTSYSKYCAFCGTPVGERTAQVFKETADERKEDKPSGTGVAELVCGILGVVFFWTVIGGIALGAVALALGLGDLKRAPEYGRGKAIAGIVLGISALALSVLVIALIVWGISMVPDINGMPVYTM